MANLSQPEITNGDPFYFHEAYVVWEIAFNEALSMQQNLGFVHLAGACLYRLRELDLALATQLRVTVYHIRGWTLKNLPTTNPFDQRYQGHIDFDYKIERRADKMFVGKLHKSSEAPDGSGPAHVHAPGEGMTVRERIDPAASESWATTMRSSFEFAQEIYAGSGGDEPAAVTLRRYLDSLLSTAEVQACLKDVGFSASELKDKVGESG